MAASSNRIHTFFVLKQPAQPDRIVVWDTQEISLGRATENDISVDDAEISRKHAHFVRTDKSYVVQNLNTSNGTLVNGEPVTTQALETRDVIRIADLELTFVQSAKDPVALGVKVEYASQLKSFSGPSVSADDAESTMLGLVDTLPGDDNDFEVKPAGEFAYDLHGMEGGPDEAPSARDLDLELEGFGLEDLDIPEEAAAKPAAQAPAEPAAQAPAQPAPQAAAQPAPQTAAKPQVWTLDDGAKESGTLSLQLEILGLKGELRRALEGLMGKVIELPAMKIRIKSDDLG
jgi:predicted component of type VI protein secretion system